MVAPRLQDLGSVELDDVDLRLSLHLSSSAQFAPSAEDVTNGESRLTAELSGRRLSGNLWIEKAQNFRLIITLQSADEESSQPDELLAQLIAARLAESKIWDTLNLTISASEIAPLSPDEGRQLSLSLVQKLPSPDAKSQQLHSIHKGVPYYDIRPPPGIARREIESVILRMHLSQSSNSTCCEDKPRRNAHDRLLLPQSHNFWDSQLTIEDVNSITENCDELTWQNGEDEELLYIDSDDAQIPRASSRSCPPEKASLEGHVLEQQSQVSSIAYPTPPSSQEAGPQTGSDQLGTSNATNAKVQQQIDPSALLPMIETGLRLALVDTPRRIPRAVRVGSKTALRPLTEVMPSLWVPRYHENVSSRVVFLPAISHAIANVARSALNSKGLEAKVIEIARREDCYDTPFLVNKTHSVQQVQDGVSRALWRTISSSLYDTSAAKRLRPLASHGRSVKDETGVDDFDSLDFVTDDLSVGQGASDFGSDDSDIESADEADDGVSELGGWDSESIFSGLQSETHDADGQSIISESDGWLDMEWEEDPQDYLLEAVSLPRRRWCLTILSDVIKC